MGKRIATLTFIAAGLAMAGCSQSVPDSSESVDTATEAAAPTEPAKPDAAVSSNLPKLAYKYALSYRLDGDAIARTQDRHLALCRELADRCQLVALERSAQDEGYPTASLKLRVASAVAATFEAQLGQAVTAAGGRALDTHVVADDVSKQIVDTQARIRQRQLLVDRTTEILRKRGGSLAEVAEAERTVAQAQEELEQARAWLAELQGRVAMSDFDIKYEAMSATRSNSVADNLAESANGSLGMFATGVQALLTLLIFLAPWGLLGGGIFWVGYRIRRRWFATGA